MWTGEQMLKKLLVAGIASACTMQGAVAADLENLATRSWSGLYIGAFGGASWADGDVDDRLFDDGTDQPGGQMGAIILNAVQGLDDLSLSDTAGIYGIQAGYNFQLEKFVVGVHADFGGLGLEGSDAQSVDVSGGVASVRAEFETDWMATLRARAGYLITEDLLIFATGGAAVADVTFKHDFDFENIFAVLDAPFSETETLWGWVAGLGMEMALSDRWSLGAEYLYTDFESFSADRRVIVTQNGQSFPTEGVFEADLDLTVHSLRAYLNFRL